MKSKKELEVLLDGIELSGLSGLSGKVKMPTSRRLVTFGLLWPRPMIALRTCTRSLRLQNGAVTSIDWQWHRRILFKESVEHRFGITVKVSDSLSVTFVKEFCRFFASSMFGMAEDLLEDIIPGPAGDVAAVPADFMQRRLAKFKNPEITAEGGIDLLPTEMEGTLKTEVPLLSVRDTYSSGSTRFSEKRTSRTRRKLLIPEGALVGKALLTINVLE